MAEREGQQITTSIMDETEGWVKGRPVVFRSPLDRLAVDSLTWATNAIGAIPIPGRDATDPDSRAEGSEAGRNDPRVAAGAIHWCADRGYELDEAEEAYVRRWWGVR